MLYNTIRLKSKITGVRALNTALTTKVSQLGQNIGARDDSEIMSDMLRKLPGSAQNDAEQDTYHPRLLNIPL